jgi:hypothetical protein
MSNISSIKQTPIAAITSRQQDSEAAIRRVVESIGFPASGVYLPPSDAPYISSVSSLFSTNVLLAENLYRVETSTATLTYVDQKVAALVDNAPAVLDTLRELAASLGDNPNLLGTLTSTIATESNRATTAEQGLSTLLNQEVSTINSNISTIVNSTINAEIERATAADNLLSTTLNQEVSTINGTISTVVTSSINAEIARATAADNALSTTLATNSANLQAQGLQSYSATPQIHRRKYTGPYVPSTFSTLYSLAGKNPYEHISNYNANVLLKPNSGDTTTVLPQYSTKWLRLGTIDLTSSSSSSAYNLSTLPTSYSGPCIPYYDIYIDPKTFYGASSDYAFVKGTGSSTAKQVHATHILTYSNTTSYSATALGGTWVALYKEDIPELEKVINIANANTIGSDVNLFINGGASLFEIAPGETAPFLYTDAGWTMDMCI